MTDSIPGLSARKGAFRLLSSVLWQHRPLDMGLDRALSGLEGPDRALARAIASQTLRWMVDFDLEIDACTRKPLPDDARARLVLRMALAQLWVLKTPAHAVVSTALPLVEAGPRRLVHGVLGRLARENHVLPAVPLLPEPYATRWQETYGIDMAEAIARATVTEAPLDIVFRSKEDEAEWAPLMGGETIVPGSVRLQDWQYVEELPGYDAGAWWVQDVAAQLPARLLNAQPGERVADLCAAPGGKTLQLAAAGAEVTAVDVSESRLRRVTENLERTGLKAEVVARDARKWKAPEPLDAIVLDAPCSATGTIRRHPDVLHLKAARNLKPLLELQRELIDHALKQLKPGGRMIYAVCSLEPEEGERQIEALLTRNPNVVLDPITPEETGGLEALYDPKGWMRTVPGHLADKGGLDGFFIARLIRKPD